MTVARLFALVFGAVYSLVGIMGFLRPLTDAPPDGLMWTGVANLLGIFAINWLHNVIHLGTGLFGVLTAGRTDSARLYARVIGIVFALVFLVGLFTSNPLGILPLNGADNVLHLASSAVALLVGFTALGLQSVGAQRRAETRA